MNRVEADKTDFKVSVAMITYNHERFIAQAIESVLMQETDFAVELVIGEDRSTDRTRDIVCDYARRYPERIHPLLPEYNLGMIPNFVETMKACQGDYVALLEGDDYWTDPTKLQQQVDFLDAHPECSICFHDVSVVDEEGQEQAATYCPSDQKRISTLEDLLLSSFVPTCSTIFRNRLYGDFPPWYYSLEIGDRPHLILNAQHGHAGYIAAVLGAYRVHPGGVWSKQQIDRRLYAVFQMYDALDAHLGGRYTSTIAQAKSDCVSDFVVRQIREVRSASEGEADARWALKRWRSDLLYPAQWERRAMAHVYAHYLFTASTNHNRPTARRSFLHLIVQDPRWLRNLGVWSIAVEGFLGATVAGWFRRVVRGFCMHAFQAKLTLRLQVYGVYQWIKKCASAL